MNAQDVKTVTLVINSDQAKKKLDALVQQLDQARKKRQEAFDKGDAKGIEVYTREASKLERQINRVQSRAQTVEKVLRNLDRATPNELKKTIKEINKELNSGNVERGSREWNVLTEAMGRVSSELSKITNEQKAAAQSMSEGAAKFGSRWVGLVTVIDKARDALGGVVGKMMGFYEQYAAMAEHMSSVKKYTGLDEEAVRDLNEAFKQMDTRTAREQLNDLAGDAGRLGIQSKQQILDFVQAADQINVALGEDLGEDAVKNIGKLAQLFGDADRMGLKQAMLSTGSVINELAQSSSASEGYLMEFTARLAGVGHQAGMTQAQVMAFGSVLDQNMVNVEKGATALQNVITALYTNPAKMAKAAGLEVKAFTDLLKTDGNAAVLQFVQALNNTGSMDKLAPILRDMNLSGAGVTQTLSTLAANIDALRQTQQQATQAFEDGTSVTNEFNVANGTAQAQLEKAQAKARDMAITLGEQLQPAAAGVLTVSGAVMRVLSTLIPFITSHIGLIIRLSSVIAAYAVVVNLTAIKTALLATVQKSLNAVYLVWMRLASTVRAVGLVLSITYNTLTGNLVKARAAQMALNKTMLANPYAAVAAAVVAIGVAIYEVFKRTSSLTEEQKAAIRTQRDLMEVQKSATQSTAEEKLKIQTLTAIIHDNTRSIADRKGAINDLRKIIPAYHGEISKEGRLIHDNTNAIDDYIKKLDEMALAEALYKKMVKNMEEQLDADLAIAAWDKGVKNRQSLMNDKSRKRNEHVETLYMPGAGGAQYVVVDDDQRQLDYDKSRLAYWKRRKQIAEQTKKTLDDYAKAHNLEKNIEALKTGGGTAIDTPEAKSVASAGGSNETDAERKAREKRERQAAKDERERLKKLKEANKAAEKEYDRAAVVLRQKAMDEYSIGKTDLLQYREQINAIGEQTIEKKRDLYDKDSEEWKKHNDDLLRLQAAHEKQSQDWSIADLSRQEKEALQKADMDHAKGLTTEEAYQEQRNSIVVDYLQRRMNLYKEYGRAEDFERTRQELTDTLNAQKLEKQKSYMERLKAMREEYETKSAKERMDIELRMLQAVYEATDETGKRISDMTEAEYNRLKKLINLKYLGTDGKVDENGTVVPGSTGEVKDEQDKKTADALEKAGRGKESGVQALDVSADSGFSALAEAAMKIKAHREVYDNLKQMRDNDLIDEKTYQAACKELDKDRFANFQAVAQAAYAAVSALMYSASQIMQANASLEEAKVTKRYDAEIEAAGSSTAKGKKLEEQKQKELAKIKTKYNKKQMAIEVAQAIAQTAMNAISAYGSVVKIPFVGPALAVAAAAAATAAGMIQVATIKKQHAAEAAGYYEGGFTGGSSYRRTAGVVHEGEFVANHQAVNNPNVLPVLQLIDHAQRTNRIASLTAADVSRAIAAPMATASNTSSAAMAQPMVQVVDTSSKATADTLSRLNERLDEGIRATVVIDGPDGLDRQWMKYNRMKNRKQ